MGIRRRGRSEEPSEGESGSRERGRENRGRTTRGDLSHTPFSTVRKRERLLPGGGVAGSEGGVAVLRRKEGISTKLGTG